VFSGRGILAGGFVFCGFSVGVLGVLFFSFWWSLGVGVFLRGVSGCVLGRGGLFGCFACFSCGFFWLVSLEVLLFRCFVLGFGVGGFFLRGVGICGMFLCVGVCCCRV